MTRIDRGPETFTKICDLYNKAECFIKHVETHQSDISIPAINQLRYAGHHLLKSLTTDDDEEFKAELRKVESHCQRSMYEASEAGILYFLDLVNEFSGDFKDVQITSVLHDYPKTLSLAVKARTMLGDGRLNRESAEKQATEYMDTFLKLGDKIHELDVSRDELNKVKASQRKSTRRFVIILTATVTGIVISAITLLSRLLD